VKKYLIGIDEAGRGPLAGPVAVGVFIIRKKQKSQLLSQARDSKQISHIKRERIFSMILEAQKNHEINFSVSLVSASIIDMKGISYAIKKAINTCLKNIGALPHEVEILLDGSLKAPKHFLDQKTIIKGDAKIPVIGLASICAKVLRDRYMLQLSKRLPKYGFEMHKGYGTAYHQKMIKMHGVSREHRKTWCRT